MVIRWRVGLVGAAVLALSLSGGGAALALSSQSAGPPPAARWHVEGIHAGTEIYQLHTRRCPVLDHSLDETMTLADGTTWSYQARYCGTIDSQGVWRGVGTFVITAGDDSSLSGRFTSSARLPTTGVPYELAVDHGTGTFAGARGSCLLDNHLVPEQPGVQHQSGTFVCDLSR